MIQETLPYNTILHYPKYITEVLKATKHSYCIQPSKYISSTHITYKYIHTLKTEIRDML